MFQHPVGLVEREDLHAREIDRTLLQVIEQATRRGDDDIGATLEFLLLRADRDAAEEGGDAQVRWQTVGRQRLVNLERELARRHEHQAARLTHPGRTAAADQQAIDHRQAERGSLAGAGLRACQQIAAAEDDGDRRELNRRRRGVAEPGERVRERGREPESDEGHAKTLQNA